MSLAVVVCCQSVKNYFGVESKPREEGADTEVFAERSSPFYAVFACRYSARCLLRDNT